MKRNSRIAFPFILCVALSFLVLLTAQKPDGNTENKSSFSQTGKASYYANMLHGNTTSNGDVYDKNDFTCAHRTLPFNTILNVTNVANGKNAIVIVNDRGPYKKGRIIDLSRSAAQKLGMLPTGVTTVKIQELNFLDLFSLNDSLLEAGQIVDSHGKLRKPKSPLIKLWQTDNLKHAIYMATNIEIEYDLDHVYIKVAGTGEDRNYLLYIPDTTKKEESDKLMAELKQDGFSLCKREKI